MALNEVVKSSTDLENGLTQNRVALKTNQDETHHLKVELGTAKAAAEQTKEVLAELKTEMDKVGAKIAMMLDAPSQGGKDVQEAYMAHLRLLSEAPERKQAQQILASAQEFIGQFQQNQ